MNIDTKTVNTLIQLGNWAKKHAQYELFNQVVQALRNELSPVRPTSVKTVSPQSPQTQVAIRQQLEEAWKGGLGK